MTINGTDITQFHAILLSKHIQPATVTTYTDWLRQGLSPLNYGCKETFKIIKLTIYLEDANEDAVADDISNLMTALKSCTLKFDDLSKYFDCTIADSLSDPDTMIAPGIHQLDVTLNSSYAYLPAVTVALSTVTQAVTNGNFAGGITGWNSSGSNSAVLSPNVYTTTATGSSSSFYVAQSLDTSTHGKRYFLRARVRITTDTSHLTELRLQLWDGASALVAKSITGVQSGTWYDLYGVVDTSSASTSVGNIAAFAAYDSAANAAGAVMEIDGTDNHGVVLIDMGTAANPTPDYSLTADKMAAKYTDYFEGTVPRPFTVQGNLPSPAVVTLTPAQDVGAVTLTGLSKGPIKVSNLHAGAPVTIDGEACTVTEPDLDTVMTTAMGSGKWMMRKYQAPNLMSPDTADPEIAPTLGIIPADSAYTQQLVSDAADLYHNKGGYDYVGHLKTAVYVASAKTVMLQMYHDDGAAVYLNNAQVYSCAHVMAPDAIDPSWRTHASVTLNLTAGWNRIDIIWIQHYGGDGIWDVSPTFSSAVSQLNAYYARDASPTGTVNKFPDTDMWQFPTLQPGDQTVTTDTPLATCGVDIQYHPKFL